MLHRCQKDHIEIACQTRCCDHSCCNGTLANSFEMTSDNCLVHHCCEPFCNHACCRAKCGMSPPACEHRDCRNKHCLEEHAYCKRESPTDRGCGHDCCNEMTLEELCMEYHGCESCAHDCCADLREDSSDAEEPEWQNHDIYNIREEQRQTPKPATKSPDKKFGLVPSNFVFEERPGANTELTHYTPAKQTSTFKPEEQSQVTATDLITALMAHSGQRGPSDQNKWRFKTAVDSVSRLSPKDVTKFVVVVDFLHRCEEASDTQPDNYAVSVTIARTKGNHLVFRSCLRKCENAPVSLKVWSDFCKDCLCRLFPGVRLDHECEKMVKMLPLAHREPIKDWYMARQVRVDSTKWLMERMGLSESKANTDDLTYTQISDCLPEEFSKILANLLAEHETIPNLLEIITKHEKANSLDSRPAHQATGGHHSSNQNYHSAHQATGGHHSNNQNSGNHDYRKFDKQKDSRRSDKHEDRSDNRDQRDSKRPKHYESNNQRPESQNKRHHDERPSGSRKQGNGLSADRPSTFVRDDMCHNRQCKETKSHKYVDCKLYPGCFDCGRSGHLKGSKSCKGRRLNH